MSAVANVDAVVEQPPTVNPTAPAPAPAERAGAGLTPHDRHFSTDHLLADIKGRSVRGGVVTLGAQTIKFALQFTATAVLARLLAPSDFGLVAMVTAITGLIGLFDDLGLSMATVQRPHITHQQISTIFWINVVFCVILAAIVAATAPLLAWVYGEPRLIGIQLVIAGTFLLAGFTAQHTALLRRQMCFSALALIEVATLFTGIAAAIVMAWHGFGYWSLVLMNVASGIVNVTLVWWFSSWRPGWPSRSAGVMPMLKFGGNLTGFTFVNYLGRNADNVLIGWWWGPAPLGLYTRAYALLMLPIKQITTPIAAVAVPTLSRLQGEPEQYRSFYCRAINAIAHLTIPSIALGAALAEDFIYVLLGPQWGTAGTIFKWLAFAALFQPVLSTVGWVCISQGTTRRMMQAACMCVPLFIAAFLIGLPWGPQGVAICYAIAVTLWLWPAFAWHLRGTPVAVKDVVAAIHRAAFLGAAVYVVTAATMLALPSVAPAGRLVIGVVVAALTWLTVVRLWSDARHELFQILALMKHLKTSKFRSIANTARRAADFAKLLIPSGIRHAVHRSRLQRRLGLAHLRSDAEHLIVNTTFGKNCRVGGQVVIRHSKLGDHSYVEAGSRITFTHAGKFCCIGPGVFLGLASHPFDGAASAHPIFYRRLPHVGYDFVDEDHDCEYEITHIGNDVWIGAGACIKDGITVGDGAIIGAGAVVTSDIPPYAIVGGVPAKVIRYRFDQPMIDFLLRFRWWERDEQWLRSNVDAIRDVRKLHQQYAGETLAAPDAAHASAPPPTLT